jgi:hypothetical protein
MKEAKTIIVCRKRIMDKTKATLKRLILLIKASIIGKKKGTIIQSFHKKM